MNTNACAKWKGEWNQENGNMVKLAVFSDLHTDFHADQGRSLIASLNKDADIAIIAGDVAAFYDFEKTLVALCSEYPEVIYVVGNHEFYHSLGMDQVYNILRDLEAKLDNFTWLHNKRVKLCGLHFVGATLWFKRLVAAQINKRYLNDFRYIPNCDPLAFDEYDYTEGWFNLVIQPGDIVVTHHAPSYKSVNHKFAGSQINCFFANRMDTMIQNKEPRLWIHGHMHDPCDYMIGKTRILCNPFGYPGENSMFNDNMIVEIESETP